DVLQAGRGHRAVLALRRPGVDLPLPADLPERAERPAVTKPPRDLVLAWGGLLLLLAVTFGIAYVPLGGGNLLLAMTIATGKALLVGIVFMKLLRGPSLVWIFAGAGVFWLA